MKERSPRSPDPNAWIATLVDDASFVRDPEPAPERGHEVIAGHARIDGRDVEIYAQDPSVGQGFVTAAGADRILRAMDRAAARRAPVVALLSSPGVDVHEGLASGEAYTRVIAKNIALSGTVLQMAVVMGVTMGAPAYSATLMDLVSFNRARSHLVVTGPTVVERMLGQKTTLGELGGSDVHARVTGLANFVDANIDAQLARVRSVVALLTAPVLEATSNAEVDPPVAPLPQIPAMNKPFDMTTLIAALVDGSRFVEYSPVFGGAMVTALARLGGRAVGIVANQSARSSGAIDADAAQKSARFIRLCDAFGLPIVTLIDVPGFLPGVREEHRGLLRHGADLCAAMITRVPRLSLVVRRCYGAAAFVMMQTRAQGGDLVLALEGARIAAMGFEAARHLVYPDQADTAEPTAVNALREAYARDYESPAVALAQGVVDEVIALDRARARLCQHLARAAHVR